MSTINAVHSDGHAATIDSSLADQFNKSLQGTLLRPGDAEYDDARTIWNAMIDKKPAMIARCAGTDDVIKAVNFAREHHLLTAIHGAGHNIAGNAVCDGGLMIDLSSMRSIRIDAKAGRAHVEPGATLGDVDKATQEHGLATPTGINSTTGIAGLTLGGGFGWLTRKHGMTVDNLVAADIVLATGDLVTASEGSHPDLFWALRGGGGNFGVVTRFEFQLHPVGPEVLTGLIVYSLDDAKSALSKHREMVSRLDDDTSVWVVMRQAPPLPFLPEEVHGTDVIIFAVCHVGDEAVGKKAIQPVREYGKVLGEFIGAQPYTAWQSAFDPLLTPGARNYWKSHNFATLSDGAIDTAIKYARTIPSPQGEIFIAHLGGAAGRVAPDAMAWSHRDAEFVLNVHSRWDDKTDDDKCIGWARDFFKESAPHATGGVYINFMTADESDRVKAGFGPSFDRLVTVKKKYDPSNLFRMNQNITT